MKKKIAVILSALTFASLFNATAYAAENGIIQNSRILVSVPSGEVFKKLGFDVTLNGETITIKDSAHTVVLENGKTSFTVDGNTITPDVPQQIINNTYYIPVRAIAEAVGAKVEWNAATKTATITYNSKAVTFDNKSAGSISVKADASGIINTYAEIIKNVQPTEYLTENFGNNWDRNDAENLGYLIYDIDNNGVPELIIRRRVHGVGFEYIVYTYKDGKAVNCGSCNGMSFSVGKKFSGIYDADPAYGYHFTAFDGTSLKRDESKDILYLLEGISEEELKSRGITVTNELLSKYNSIIIGDNTLVKSEDYVISLSVNDFISCSDLSAVNSVTLTTTIPVYTVTSVEKAVTAAPAAATSQNVNEEEIYRPVIEACIKALKGDDSDLEKYQLFDYRINMLSRYDLYNYNVNNIGYVLKDIDGNGIKELLIVDVDSMIVTAYSIANGKPVQLLSSVERGMYYLGKEDNTIVLPHGSGGASSGVSGIYKIGSDGKSLEVKEAVFYEEFDINYSNTLDYFPEDGSRNGLTAISLEELEEFEKKCNDLVIDIDSTPLSEYEQPAAAQTTLSVSDAYKQALADAPKTLAQEGVTCKIKDYTLCSIDGDDVPELIIHYHNEDSPDYPKYIYKVYSVKYHDSDGTPNNGVLLDCGTINVLGTYYKCDLIWHDYKDDKCLLVPGHNEKIGWRLNYNKLEKSGFGYDIHSQLGEIDLCEHYGIPVNNGNPDTEKLYALLDEATNNLETYDISNLKPIEAITQK